MKTVHAILLSIFLTGCTTPVSPELGRPDITGNPTLTKGGCLSDRAAFRCVQFLKNYDGDTATFDIPSMPALFGEKIPVRLIGIDSPEIRGRGPCEKEKALQARELVTRILETAQQIDLMAPQRDKYFRILADARADGLSISQKLLNLTIQVC